MIGLQPDPQLNRVVDDRRRAVPVPHEGLLLSDILAELLDVRAGDRVTLEIFTGQRPVVEVPVTAVVSTYVGTAAYMNIHALRRLLRQGDTISGAYLSADERAMPELFHTLKVTPAVASVTVKRQAITSFEDTVAENILRMRMFNMIFATIIAFGVTPAGRSAHRVGGTGPQPGDHAHPGVYACGMFDGAAGRVGSMTIASLPLGLFAGHSLAKLVTSALGGDTVRIPFVIQPSTYGLAVVVVLIAAMVSGMIVPRAWTNWISLRC